MLKIYRALRSAFTAIAFAEAGEFDTARELLQVDTSAPPTIKSSHSSQEPDTGRVRGAAPAI